MLKQWDMRCYGRPPAVGQVQQEGSTCGGRKGFEEKVPSKLELK